MKGLFIKSLAVFFCLTPGKSFAQDYQTITGIYYNTNVNTILCGCNTQGLLSYVASDGNSYGMTLCFDTEPGNFYQIYDGEEITVEGEVKNVPCANGQSYLVLYVQTSELQVMNRMLVADEFIKKQSIPSKQKTPAKPATTSKEKPSSEITLQGHYTEKGSTMNDWRNFSNCKACGALNNNLDQPIIFDKISTAPEYMVNIKVWGYKEGKNFYVTKWQKL